MVDSAITSLREAILSGDILPGSRIPIEETAERLGMSPIPVREALRSLASEGLVIALPQRGYRVAHLTRDDMDELFTLRTHLEVLAVQQALPRLKDTHLRTLQREIVELTAAQRDHDWRRQQFHHRAFHFAFFEVAGSPRLLWMLAMLWDHCERYLRMAEGFRERPENVGNEHQVLVEAYRSGSLILAEQRTREHVEFTKSTALRMLDAQGPTGEPDGGVVGVSGDYVQVRAAKR